MNKLVATAAATTAAVAAIALGGASAQAHTDSHTLRLLDHSVANTQVSTNDFVSASSDSWDGKVVGYTSLRGHYDPERNTIRLQAACALRGGIIYVNFPAQNADNKTDYGRVTGGTGRFAGAHGTIKATSVSDTDNKIVIHYWN